MREASYCAIDLLNLIYKKFDRFLIEPVNIAILE